MTNEFDRSYNRGYAAGYASGKETVPSLEAIQARYEYLRLGGQWHRRTVDTEDAYLAGFEDAMKVLGLLPMVGP